MELFSKKVAYLSMLMYGYKKFTPSVDKRILVLLAGTMWCGVGIMLVSLAVSWLSPLASRSQEYIMLQLFSLLCLSIILVS